MLAPAKEGPISDLKILIRTKLLKKSVKKLTLLSFTIAF
jgi:hypothetical protein